MDNVLDRIDEDEEQKSEEFSGEPNEKEHEHKATLQTFEGEEDDEEESDEASD